MSAPNGRLSRLPEPKISRREALRVAGSAALALQSLRAAAQSSEPYEVIVYGATPSGAIAAVAAARMGVRVLLLAPEKQAGGNLANGMPCTGMIPSGQRDLIGGLAKEFDARVTAKRTEGRIAAIVLTEMLEAAGVTVRLGSGFASLAKERGRIRSLVLDDGSVIGGSVFIDASYEGDLMAAAGVPYAVGREPAMKYGESVGGVHLEEPKVAVNPFDAEGPLPGISAGGPGVVESGDAKVATYQMRVWLVAEREIEAPIEEPAGYEARNFELLGRCLAVGAAGSLEDLLGWQTLPGNRVAVAESRKSVVSLGLPGAQFAYPQGSRAAREEIYRAHLRHAQGLLWFLRTDRRVPEPIRKAILGYGLCADLWTGSRHWPPAMEVREARRMLGELIVTQRDLSYRREKTDSIGLGFGGAECPVVDRFAVGRDAFVNEGRFWRKGKPFQIPWLAMLPRGVHCENLLTPVCLSASHVAWHGLRSEWTLMALGEGAGVAAALTVDKGKAVQELDPLVLQAKLRRLGAVLDLPREK